MSQVDKDKVMNLRKRSSEAKSRKAAAAYSEESVDAEEDPADDASNQLKRNSHKKTKRVGIKE